MSKIIAHRGFSGKYPENTMLAFTKSLEYGADGVELDIQLTKDGEVVICHDEIINRTSNGEGFIKDYTLAELKEFIFDNQMENLDDATEDNLKIPTLSEFLDWFKSTEMMVNIEFKTSIIPYPSIVEKTVRLVKERRLQERVIFSSFNHDTIKKVKALDDTLECGFLTVANLLEPGRYCHTYNVEYYHPVYVSLQLTPEIIENCKQYGIGINTYTVNEKADIQKFLELNIDGIITNEVELALELAK